MSSAIPRIFQAVPLTPKSNVVLDSAASHHVARVLRAKIGDSLIIFNGEGGEYASVIANINKKNITVEIQKFIPKDVESSLQLYLAQGISRGEKMDYTIQKAVELGVKKIFPLLTEYCNVKLDLDRREKRLQHWSNIIIGACEQSGRNSIPDIFLPEFLDNFLKNTAADYKFVLDPDAKNKLAQFTIKANSSVILLVGPEGGLSSKEIQQATDHGFISLNLGPRILRTETAALVALTVLQGYIGDLC